MVTQTISTEVADQPACWQVGDWLVDPQANQLVQDDRTVVLVPKVMAVLCVLIEHAGQPVTNELFMQRVWGRAVVTDASLYQAISQLRKALGDSKKPRRYIDRVSSKGYILRASVKPWNQPSSEVLPSTPVQPASTQTIRNTPWLRNRYLLATLSMIICALVLVGIFNRSATKIDDAPLVAIQRVAVLPFKLLGSNDSPYWLDGFADTLVSRLAGRQDLQVVYQSVKTNPAAEDYAGLLSKLDVDALLLGTVQQDQQQLRINIRVVTEQQSQAEHAEVIDGNVDNLFALQDSVASRLLGVLRPTDPATQAATQPLSESAWQHYLLGRFHWAKRKSHNLDLAIDYFKRSLADEPGFVLGYVGLCDSYHFQYLYADWPLDKALDQCEPLLEKALAIDPELGQVHASLGLLAQSQDNAEKTRYHLQKATELAPNYAPGWMWYGRFLRRHGEIDKALAYHQTALRLDPLSPIATRNLAFSLLASGIVNEARDVYARALELEPDYTNRPLEEIEFLPLTAERAAAFLSWSEEFGDRYLSDTVNRLVKAQILLSLNDAPAAAQALASVPADFHRHPYYLYTWGLVELAQGNYDQALDVFTRRMEAESSNRQRVMPVVGVLQYAGKHSQARALFLENYPSFEKTEDIALSPDNAWLFAILASITDPESAQGQTIKGKIANWLAGSAEDSWLSVWLLTLHGDLDEAATRLSRMLEAGWLPNYQEMLIPLDRDSVFINLTENQNGERIQQLLQRNRHRVTSR